MQSFSYNSYSEPSSLASFSSSPSSVALWIHDDYRNEEEVCKVLYGIFAANEKRVCQIQSPYVQKCINFVDMGERSEITFRKAKGGSLEDFVGKNGALKDRELRIIGYRLFKALYDIHSLNICHNDIRPENILLLEERDFTTSMLSNFGVSGQGEIYGSYGTEWFSSPECFSSSNNQNSYYNSPAYSIYEDEKSLSNHHNLKSDLWAAGITLYFLATNSLPFNAFVHNSMIKDIMSGLNTMKSSAKFLSLDDDLRDLLSKLIKVNPEERIIAEEALKHPYFIGMEM